MFADDLKIISLVNTLGDCPSLQSELNSMVFWFNSIGLQIITDKCHNAVKFFIFLNNNSIFISHNKYAFTI
ncbi:cancer-associated gene 1 protein [Aphis craccivora]|uniref:Cancer-associated gene 1 protein n=1 Tax=Aphis craccivora TaxID=307492 RepID=A0A6G0ZFZ6_APHCR|nr:cancer-associated gene 1 protein [Aphis craccivora]